MLVLGIDTSTDTLALSLAEGGVALGSLTLGGAKEGRPREHAESLLPALASLLQLAGHGPADLEGVAVVKGPGGFTGVRTGLTVAKTVSQSLDIPIIGISSLEAMSFSFPGIGLVSPMLDARRKEVFAALYRKKIDSSEILIEPALWELEAWLSELSVFEEDIFFIGEGAERYGSSIVTSNRLPLGFAVEGTRLALLGEQKLLSGQRDDALALAPDYMRLPSMVVAWQKKKDEQSKKDSL